MSKPTIFKCTLCCLLLSLVTFFGCKKDNLFNKSTITEQETTHVIKQPADPLTLPLAQEFFNRQQQEITFRAEESDSAKIFMGRIQLLWDFADTARYMQHSPLLLVPVAVGPDFDVNSGNQVCMAFFINEYGEMDSRLLFIRASDTYDWNSNTFAANFTGDVVQLDWHGDIVYSFRFENGQLSKRLGQTDKVTFRTDAVVCSGDYLPLTFDYNVGGVHIHFTLCVNIGSGGGNTFTNPFNFGPTPGITPLPNDPTPTSNTGGGTGSNNGSPTTVDDYFDLNQFTGQNRIIAQNINKFKDKYCLSGTAPAILDQVSSKCGLSTNVSEKVMEIRDLLFNTPSEMPDCAIDVIAADMLGANMAQREYFKSHRDQFEMAVNFVQDNGCTESAKSAMANAIKTIQQYNLTFFTSEDVQLIFEHPQIYATYQQFLAQNPNATEEQKKTVLRMVAFAPSNQITNLQQRLNCFNTSSNSNYTHTVTLCVDQPVAGEDDSFSSKELAGHTFLILEQNQGN